MALWHGPGWTRERSADVSVWPAGDFLQGTELHQVRVSWRLLSAAGCLPPAETHGILPHSGDEHVIVRTGAVTSIMTKVYLPCALIVVLSWVGFWLNREATSDRVTLGRSGNYHIISHCNSSLERVIDIGALQATWNVLVVLSLCI